MERNRHPNKKNALVCRNCGCPKAYKRKKGIHCMNCGWVAHRMKGGM